MQSGVLRDKNSTVSPARWAGALSCWKVTLRAVYKLNGIFHIGNFCFWVPFLKQLLLRNCAVDFVEICNVYIKKMIIKAKRIFNSDKIYRSYSDLNFGVTFLEHSIVACAFTTWQFNVSLFHVANAVFAILSIRYTASSPALCKYCRPPSSIVRGQCGSWSDHRIQYTLKNNKTIWSMVMGCQKKQTCSWSSKQVNKMLSYRRETALQGAL